MSRTADGPTQEPLVNTHVIRHIGRMQLNNSEHSCDTSRRADAGKHEPLFSDITCVSSKSVAFISERRLHIRASPTYQSVAFILPVAFILAFEFVINDVL